MKREIRKIIELTEQSKEPLASEINILAKKALKLDVSDRIHNHTDNEWYPLVCRACARIAIKG